MGIHIVWPMLSRVFFNHTRVLAELPRQAPVAAVRMPLGPCGVQAKWFGSHKGTVKWFNTEKGFGFIEADGNEFFVHYTGIDGTGFRSLDEGEEVEFDTQPDPKNPDREKACNVTGPGGAPVKGAPRQDRQEW